MIIINCPDNLNIYTTHIPTCLIATNMVFSDGWVSDGRFMLYSRTKDLLLLGYQISGSLFLYLCHCIVYVFVHDFLLLFQQCSRAKNNFTLVFGNAGDKKKICTRAAAKKFFDQFNYIFELKFTIKKLLQQHCSLLKNKDSYL